MLSFTNSAVEKFIEDCGKADIARFLRFPHFVGTFDAFVRHFIVLPPGIAASASRPIIIDSWDTLGVNVRLTGSKAFRGEGLSLDKFDAETGVVELAGIGHLALHKHVTQYQEDYQNVAERMRNALYRKHGLISTADARIEARRHLQDFNWSQALGKAIKARFHEVIVDEAQDCNPLDLDILVWLRSHGIRVTVVCDPDQAIYAFRHGSATDLLKFGETYKVGDRLCLTGNFRSSKPICALAATLRNRREPDSALGSTAGITHPVIVAAYSGKITGNIGQLFIERIETANVGLSSKDGIVLAHKLDDAQRAAGNPILSDVCGTSQIETVARIVGEFWSPSATKRTRESALQTMERLLLILLRHWNEKEDRYPVRVIERAKLNRRELRRQALDVLMQLPKTCNDTDQERCDWVDSVRNQMSRLQLILPQGQTLGKVFRRPPTKKWAEHLRAPVIKSLSCSTVHEAKGREYEAVCVVLKPDHAPLNRTSKVFEAWKERTDSEAKRVIYVGVTRARTLAFLAVPSSFTDRCCTILDHGGTPYERVKIDGRASGGRELALFDYASLQVF